MRKTVTLDAVAAARKAKLESFAFSAEQPRADTYFPKAAEDATRAALGETIQREGIGIVRLVKGLFEKQLSRTERVIETVKTNAHDAGVKAQQQGDAKRAEQEAQKASAPIENPFV